MPYATISSKGQVTLPVKILRHLGLKAKDRIEIQETEDGLQIRKATDFFNLKGSVKRRKIGDEKSQMMRAVSRHVMDHKK